MTPQGKMVFCKIFSLRLGRLGLAWPGLGRGVRENMMVDIAITNLPRGEGGAGGKMVFHIIDLVAMMVDIAMSCLAIDISTIITPSMVFW